MSEFIGFFLLGTKEQTAEVVRERLAEYKNTDATERAQHFSYIVAPVSGIQLMQYLYKDGVWGVVIEGEAHMLYTLCIDPVRELEVLKADFQEMYL